MTIESERFLLTVLCRQTVNKGADFAHKNKKYWANEKESLNQTLSMRFNDKLPDIPDRYDALEMIYKLMNIFDKIATNSDEEKNTITTITAVIYEMVFEEQLGSPIIVFYDLVEEYQKYLK